LLKACVKTVGNWIMMLQTVFRDCSLGRCQPCC